LPTGAAKYKLLEKKSSVPEATMIPGKEGLSLRRIEVVAAFEGVEVTCSKFERVHEQQARAASGQIRDR